MSTLTAPRTGKLATTDIGDPAALVARTQEREEFYRSFVESLGEGVIITDRESRILYANSRIECLTGYPRSELVGAISYELLMPKEEWPVMRRRLKERLAGKEESYEYEHARKDGERHWVSVRALPYRNGRGEIVGTIGLLSCIKERKTLEFENEYLRRSCGGTTAPFSAGARCLKKCSRKSKWSRPPMPVSWFSANRAPAKNSLPAPFTIAVPAGMRRSCE